MSSSTRLATFQNWMVQHNIWVDDRILLCDNESNVAAGVGVLAKSALQSGDVITRIPKKSVLSWRNSACASAIEKSGIRGGIATIAALMYEWHLGTASPWHGYLQLLPSFEPLPFFWTDDELSYLKGTELERSVIEDREQVQKDYIKLIRPLTKKHSVLFPAAVHTYDHFARMGSLVASRAFYVDEYHGQAMLPVADLYNHTYNETVHVVGDDRKTPLQSDEEEEEDNANNESPDELEMVLIADVGPEEEVWNTYGTLGNDVLLSKYGFAELDNPHDRVSLSIRQVCVLVVGQSQFQQRIRFWNRHADQESLYWLDRSAKIPDSLLGVVFTICVDDAVFCTWSDLSAVEDATAEEILALPKVRQVLTEGIKARLNQIAHPGSAADERLQLASLSDSKLRFAAIVRISEKEILESCLEQVEVAQNPRKKRKTVTKK